MNKKSALSKYVTWAILFILTLILFTYFLFILFLMKVNIFIVLLLGGVLFAFLAYGAKSGSTNISYTCEIKLKNAHIISILSTWEVAQDEFHLIIDGKKVYSGATGYFLSYPFFRYTGSEKILVDDEQLKLRWRWSVLWGNPIYIVLERDGDVVAHYGKYGAIEKLGFQRNSNGMFPNRLIQARLIREIISTEKEQTVSEEEYPIDNRFGSDVVTIEQEVSKTVSNLMTCENTTLVQMGISADVLKVITGQISLDLSKKFSISFEETVTKRHTFRFSVQPNRFVIYKVCWKNRIRDGKYLLQIDDTDVEIPYQAHFGLSYNLSSLSGAQQ